MTNQEKIAIANSMIDTLKDYIELLKVQPKVKQKFNAVAIKEQIQVNENTVLESAKLITE